MRTVRFDGAAVLEYKPNGGPWVVRESFVVRWGHGNTVTVFNVPKGFHTDLASIPRALHSLVPIVGRHIQPAIAHEFCYRDFRDTSLALSRFDADLLFLDGMKEMGVRLTRRWVMYLAVRM